MHAKSSGNQDTIGDYSFPCNTVELKNKKKTWVEWHGRCSVVTIAFFPGRVVRHSKKSTRPINKYPSSGCKIQPCTHLNLVEERKTKLYGQTLWQTRVNPRRNHALTLELNSTVPLYKSDKEIDYSSCDEQHNAHYHPGAVIHWWGWTDTWRHRRLPGNTDSLEFDSLDDESCRRTFVSMITNTLDEFIEKINRGGTKYIACMVARQPSKSKKCGCQFWRNMHKSITATVITNKGVLHCMHASKSSLSRKYSTM